MKHSVILNSRFKNLYYHCKPECYSNMLNGTHLKNEWYQIHPTADFYFFSSGRKDSSGGKSEGGEGTVKVNEAKQQLALTLQVLSPNWDYCYNQVWTSVNIFLPENT